jgi:hypothetical protein
LNFDSVSQALTGNVLVRDTTTATTTITAAGVGVDVNNNTSTQKIEVAKNSGANIGTRKQLNFVEGANITLTIADDAINDQVDITIEASGGGGGTVNTGQVLVDFGAGETDIVQTTVAAGWVTPSSVILCNAVAIDTADHTADEVVVEKIQAYSTNLVNGVGFDIITASAGDSGTSWGKYNINYSGA